jgi:hypothetical protein
MAQVEKAALAIAAPTQCVADSWDEPEC